MLIVDDSIYWLIMLVFLVCVIVVIFIYFYDMLINDPEDDIDLQASYEDDIKDKLDMVDNTDEEENDDT